MRHRQYDSSMMSCLLKMPATWSDRVFVQGRRNNLHCPRFWPWRIRPSSCPGLAWHSLFCHYVLLISCYLVDHNVSYCLFFLVCLLYLVYISCSNFFIAHVQLRQDVVCNVLLEYSCTYVVTSVVIFKCLFEQYDLKLSFVP